MSKYDNASLVQIPSGYKASTLYSVLPQNGDGDFDFTRGSTATRVNENGLIESVGSNVPRLDYPLLNGVVQDCPALLLEPSRTNLVTYSEDFTQWSNTGGETIDVSDSSISPDGSNNATKLQEVDSSFGYHRISKALSLSSVTDYSLSIFAKKGTLNCVQLLLINTTNSETASKVFDLENGVLGETILNGAGVLQDAKIEDYGNGWYRCSIVGQLNSSPNTFRINLAENPTGNTSSLGMVQYAGDGNGSIFMYGAQLEQGSYATSYIPTSGTTVTRSADVCNGAGTASDFNDSEGVLFAEMAKDKGNQYSLISLQKSGTTNTYAYIGFLNNNTQIKTEVKVAGTTSFNKTRTFSSTDVSFKVAVKYKSGDYAFWINGFETDTGTDSTIFSDGDLNELEFGNHNNSLFRYYGKTKQLAAFNVALSDTQLEDLTSWDSFAEMAQSQLYTTY